MSETALYGLVLLSAIVLASWQALLKRDPDRTTTLVGIRVVGLVYGSFALLWAGPPGWSASPWLCAGTVALCSYFVFLLAGYRYGEFSVVFPAIRATAPLVVTFLVYAITDETPTPVQAAAIVAIVIGLVMLGSARAAPPAALGYALAGGVAIAVASTMTGVGARRAAGALAYHGALEATLGVITLAAYLARRGFSGIHDLRNSYRRWVLAGTLSVSSYLVFVLAVRSLPVGPVTAVRESSSLFALAIGAIFLGESLDAKKVMAVTLMTAGVVAIVAIA
jgi:drug/metabolite transporter (DMT)-like permease